MKFNKILSHNSSPQSQNNNGITKPTFIPPPLGLDVVTMPKVQIFDQFLSGNISAKELLSMGKEGIIIPRKQLLRRQATRHNTLKRNQADQIFNVVEQFQQSKQITPEKNQLYKLNRKNTLLQLTSSRKEISFPITKSRLKHQNCMIDEQMLKDAQLINRCEKLSGERLNEDEKEFLLKKEINDEDMWKMMNIFQKKRWFFDYLHRNLDQQKSQPPSTENSQSKISLLSKLRVAFLNKESKRKPEKQCQQYFTHIQNIEDNIKQKVFNRNLPEQIKRQPKLSVKEFRSESEVEKLNIRNQFIETTRNFNINKSNPDLYSEIFLDGTQTCRPQQKKQLIKRTKRAQLSREHEISHESQDDSYRSITEFRLNELYQESNQRQKQYQEKYDTNYIDNGDLLQKKVKNLVRLGNIQKAIHNVVQIKLQQ